MSTHNREVSLPHLNNHVTVHRIHSLQESPSNTAQIPSTFLHQRVAEIMRKAIFPAAQAYGQRPIVQQIRKFSKVSPCKSTNKKKFVPKKFNFVPISGTRKTLSNKRRNIGRSLKRPTIRYQNAVYTQESRDSIDEALDGFNFTEKFQNRITIFSKLRKPLPQQPSSGNSLSRESLENYYKIYNL